MADSTHIHGRPRAFTKDQVVVSSDNAEPVAISLREFNGRSRFLFATNRINDTSADFTIHHAWTLAFSCIFYNADVINGTTLQMLDDNGTVIWTSGLLFLGGTFQTLSFSDNKLIRCGCSEWRHSLSSWAIPNHFASVHSAHDSLTIVLCELNSTITINVMERNRAKITEFGLTGDAATNAEFGYVDFAADRDSVRALAMNMSKSKIRDWTVAALFQTTDPAVLTLAQALIEMSSELERLRLRVEELLKLS